MKKFYQKFLQKLTRFALRFLYDNLRDYLEREIGSHGTMLVHNALLCDEVDIEEC